MGVKYENSPPPSDFEYDDIEIPIFFVFPRPQQVHAPPFLTVDYSLIHPRLLGSYSEKNSDETNENETGQDANNNASENPNENLKEVEQKNATENEKINLITATDQNTISNRLYKKKNKVHKEKENSSKVKNKSKDVFQNEDHMYSAHGRKKQKRNKRNHSKRDKSSIDSDDESNINSNGVEVSRIESISKSYLKESETKRKHTKRSQSKRNKSSIDSDDESNINTNGVEVSRIESISKPYLKESVTTAKDPDCRKPKSRKYLKSKYSKRVPISDDDQSSSSHRSKTSDYYSRKCKELKSISSDGEQSLSHSSKTSKQGLISPEVKVKQEVFSDEEESSYLGKPESCTRERSSESDGSSDNASFYNRRHGKNCYDDDRYFEWRSPKREVEQEIQREPVDREDSKEFHGPDIFYCSYCKLSLNSDLIWQSHLRGKKHAKAIRAQSVSEVAKSSLIPSTYIPISEEGNRRDRPAPGMERKELKNAVSSIQEVCDGLKDRPVGLRHMWEIRLETETVYYCNLCDAPCAASSVMLHLTGYKHRLGCLKEYFPQIYDRLKDVYKKRIEITMKEKFLKHERVFRKQKVRVFTEIPIGGDTKKSGYPFNQPGPSWQGASQIKLETLTINDEKGKSVVPSNQDILNTKFADFHCTVCDSHMNNIQMWESHIRGRRHLKNLRKAPEGLAATNKYVEAPSGTVSNLVRQIEEVCTGYDVIVGLNYIRENQGKQGNQYNCFPCGGCCSDIDIIDHILAMKHKIKILEKMHFDGFLNSIMTINNFQVSNHYRESLVDQECRDMVDKYGRGRPQVYYIKRDLRDYGAL